MNNSEVSEMSNPKKTALSKTEYGIYFDYLSNPASIAYNIPLYLKLDRDIDITGLKQAVEKSIENHPYLKSRLTADSDGAVYKLSSDEPAVVEVKELHEADFDRKSLVYPFDLLSERLYRCSIICLETYVLLFCDFHHIIFDGSSAKIFLNDVDRAYNGMPLEPEHFTGNDVSNE